MKVHFLSIHRIIYENKQCEQITLNQGMEQFANDLLGHVLVKKNVRNYDSTDQSEPIQLAGKIRNAVDGGEKDWKKQAEGYAKKIAEHLLKVEEPFHNVQRGSLIQAVIDREDNGRTVYVLAKVAHTAFVDDAHYTTQNGFPRDEKQIWKTCILEWKESPETAKAQVFSNTEAKYWWDSFLKLTPETNNATNTRRVFETINSTMNRFFGAQKKKKVRDAECCMYDHSIIKSAFMLRLRQGTQLIYDDMINDILDKYNPVFTTPEAINELKEMLLEKSGFDKNFCLDSTELKSDYVTKFSLGNGVTIGIQMDTFDLSNISVQEDGVNRILCIRYPATTAMDAYIKALLKLGEGRKQVGNKNDTE